MSKKINRKGVLVIKKEENSLSNYPLLSNRARDSTRLKLTDNIV